MKRRGLDRRRFLQAIGASALTYPFLRGLPSFAQANTAPKYLVLVFTPCGVVRPYWGANGPARGTSVVTSPLTGATGAGAFRQTLMPFAKGPTAANVPIASPQDLTNQVIVLDGLNVATADGSHEAGMGALWTGIENTGAGAAGKGMSVDQAVAQHLVQSGVQKPFASLPLMVRDSQDFTDRSVQTRMCYDATDFIDPYDDPVAALEAVFLQAPPGDGGASPIDKQAKIRQVVFGQIDSELTTIKGKLCTEDRDRLSSIQDAWAGLNAQFAAVQAAVKNCPTQPTPLTGALDFPTAAKAQMDLAALAIQCDLTRVVTLQFSTATSNVTHKWIDPADSGTHHVHSHTGPSSLYEFGANLYDPTQYHPPGDGITAGSLWDPHLAQIDLWYANQVAYLAQRLAGFGVLAQTLICWGSELDMGQAHNHDDTPFLLVGGSNVLATGQLVQFPLNIADGSGNRSPVGNRFHNDLLVTLANAMGVPMTTFGTAAGLPGRYNGVPLPSPLVDFQGGPITQILKS
ncbi:MAG TPA: DUF1552 domain-containing protein [Polyangiaceae bacterium]|jgi:hypothetical protein